METGLPFKCIMSQNNILDNFLFAQNDKIQNYLQWIKILTKSKSKCSFMKKRSVGSIILI